MTNGPGGHSDAASALAAQQEQTGPDPFATNPALRTFFECYLQTFVFEGHIDPKLRELAILRVMWRCGQAFEWGNHYRLARNVGLSRADIVAIRTPDPERVLEGDAALAARVADEVVDLARLTPETLAACRARFPDPGLLHEFLYVVAGYRMIATVSATLGRTPPADAPLWPPDGIGPDGTRQER